MVQNRSFTLILMLLMTLVVKGVAFASDVVEIDSAVEVVAPNAMIFGEVRDAKGGEPIIGASVMLNGSFVWAVTDRYGRFALNSAADATNGVEITVSYLGYVSQVVQLSKERIYASATVPVAIMLRESSLAIEEVVVMAEVKQEEPNTTYTVGNEALKHTQINDVANIATLLPGGKTSNPDLTSESTFSLRDGGDSSAGNAAFGTAIEVDGVRLSNNASFSGLDGVGTRSVAVENIESIEVITGVPSVEHGDVNSGVVIVKTKRGKSPLNASLTINPRTYQVAASKGLSLGNGGDNGVMNVSGEWARATNSLVSPYTSYTRRGASAIYSNTFGTKMLGTSRDNVKFEMGATVNIGGSNSKDDPDAYTGEYTKGRDNAIRANTSVEWLLNRPGVTNLKFDLSANYHDRTTHTHKYYSYASQQPSVNATEEGYFMANQLDYTFFADAFVESKEINIAAAAKYELNSDIGSAKSRFKAGAQWKLTGNMGQGTYYGDYAYAPSGFRPRDYSQYPYMHNISLYAEERFVIPFGSRGGSLTLVPGVRMEHLALDNSAYSNTTSFSPRFNAALKINNGVTLRGGWGVTEKLPSYFILFAEQEYRDILSFGATYNGNEAFYSYYTQPYTLQANEKLRWQRSQNSEIGIDANFKGVKFGLTAFSNKTKGAYQYVNDYSPFSYNTYVLPSDFTMPTNPEIKVDSQTGDIYVRDLDVVNSEWRAMDLNVTNTTFAKVTYADNGADVLRRGVELMVDFPEIKVLKTKFRFDAAYTNVSYHDESLSYYYQSGLTHSTESGKSYEYVGIYATGNSGSSTTLYNGSNSRKLNANITAVTHIPKARLIISCRVEMSLLNRWQYSSEYNGKEYAFNSDEYGNPTGGSIYDGDSYTTIYPVKYMDASGNIYDFKESDVANSAFSNLIRTSSNAYTFSAGGYDPYVSANLSVTKEIGDFVSLSFYANNFTNSRKAVTSYSTGVSAIFTPSFYYGLTCRVKF
ncbi:MAG: TonB-dependent receptor [Rikenellaceae bacterium]